MGGGWGPNKENNNPLERKVDGVVSCLLCLGRRVEMGTSLTVRGKAFLLLFLPSGPSSQ